MDSRPPTPTRRTEVFISAASADLKASRAIVKQAVDTIGCHGVYQEEFPPDYRRVDEMLRSHITNCDAVIHIAGVCYGSEPRDRPADKARRSYTQMEYDIAQELGRPLYVFVCTEAYPYDAHSPEPDDVAALQQAHREACLARLEIREKVSNPSDLKARVSQLHEHLKKLERVLIETEKAVEAVGQKVEDVHSLQKEHGEKLGEIQSTLTALQVAKVSDPLPSTSNKADEEPIPADIQAELDKGDSLDGECKYAEAAAVYENAVKLAESAGNKRALIKARIDHGEALTREESNLEIAKEVLSACLADFKTNPDPKSRSTVLHLLGHIEICQGRIQEGRALCREALESARARGDRFQEGSFLIAVAHAEEMSGDLPEAYRLLDEAASVFRVEYRELEGKEKARAGTNLAAAFAMKAAVYEHEGKVEEMLAGLTEAENLCRKENHSDNLARVLVSKCRALFAKSKWNEGVKALDEARDLFNRIGNVHWLLKCYDIRARLAFQMSDQRLALAVCMGAIAIAAEQGTPEDHVHVLGQTAALCRRNGLDEAAATFHAEAKRLATEHNLTDLQVDLLLDEANIRRGKDERREDDDEGKRIVREALARLEALLVKCEVKGRRAHYMSRIGSLHGRLRNLTEARSWFEQALRNFEEIGDAGGIADSLGMLAATAREEEDKGVAIRLLESLLERSKGKPLHHFQGGAHHDLVSLKMSQGDMAGARKHFDVSTSICAGHPMPDVQEALRETQKRLEGAERSRKPTASDLPTMLRELHAWKDRYPQLAGAILAFWYHGCSPELWSNCRSLFGVKFLVRARSVKSFERFADRWACLGDLFIYAASFPLKAKRGIDVFPFPLEMWVPPGLPSIKCETPLTPEEQMKAVIAALNEVPYFITVFDGTFPPFPDDKLFIIGRRYRVPDAIRRFMLCNEVENLISRRLIAMPVRQREDDTSLIHDMCVAWENRLLPVFFDSLPADRETSLERTVHLAFPQAESVRKADGSTSSNAHGSLRKFMAEVGGNPDVALAQLADAWMIANTVRNNSETETVTASLHVIGFKAGPTRVHHPALVVDSQEMGLGILEARQDPRSLTHSGTHSGLEGPSEPRRRRARRGAGASVAPKRG